jgi:hypothetical protein
VGDSFLFLSLDTKTLRIYVVQVLVLLAIAAVGKHLQHIAQAWFERWEPASCAAAQGC